MKNVIQNLNDITDSREMLEAKPHPFTVIFIYILIAMIISALVWAYFGEIDIVVKANGIVRPNEKERIIKNEVFGKVEKTNLEDGEKVEKGDILYVINHNDLQSEKEFLENELSKLSIENNNLLKLKKSINDNKNYFNKDTVNEVDYYYKYLKYESDCKSIKVQSKKSELEMKRSKKNDQLSNNNFADKARTVTKELEQLNKLKDSVEKNKSMFTNEKELYKQRYLDYESKTNKYKNMIKQKEILLKDLQDKRKQLENDVKIGADNSETELENAKIELENYKVKFITDIVTTIKNNNIKVQDIDYALELSKSNKEHTEEVLENTKLLKESIEKGKNLLETKDEEEKEKRMPYIRKYKAYMANISSLSMTSTNSQRAVYSLDGEIKRLKGEKEGLQSQITQLREVYNEAVNNNSEEAEKCLNSIKEAQNKLANVCNNIAQYEAELIMVNNKLENELRSSESYKKDLIQELNSSIDELTRSNNNINVEIKSNETKKEELLNSNKNLKLLQESINKNKNLFNKENKQYYGIYEDYINNMRKLKNSIELANNKVKQSKSKDSNFDINFNKQLNEAEINLDNAKIELKEFKNQFILSLNNEIEQSNKTLDDLKMNYYKTSDNAEIYDTERKLNEVTLKKYETDTLVGINDSLKSMDNKIDEISKQVDSVKNRIEDCIVRAPMNGIVNIVKEISNEELIQSGTEIATIISDDNSKYRIELFISNKDIAKVNEGNEIKYSFEALPYREYGQIKGKIMNIGVDSKINNSGVSYYAVESEMENRVLYSYKGEEAEIKVGMTCEAQVITETKKILYYILEKINLKD